MPHYFLDLLKTHSTTASVLTLILVTLNMLMDISMATQSPVESISRF
jgi:hypothetical protein